MTDPDLRLPPGEVVTPERAGWRYLSFAVHELSQPMQVGAPDTETAIVGLAGGAFRVGQLELAGRSSVWDGLPSAVYLPPGQVATVEPLDGLLTVAVASAPASGRATADAPVRIGPEDVRVEVRGAGNATRQINHIITPEFPADRLEVVEVYTPSGNWSSWPPHKHDTDDMPREAILEEVYHYRFRRRRGVGRPAALRRLRRGAVGGAGWRNRHRARRVPPVRRHPRRRCLLPQRPCRRRADHGLLLRPRPRPRPRVVGFTGAGSARPPGALVRFARVHGVGVAPDATNREGAGPHSSRVVRGATENAWAVVRPYLVSPRATHAEARLNERPRPAEAEPGP